ncbi:MAG: hypothetical protein ACKO40_06000 [Planctomycetaceae bacterium]
MRLTVRTLLAWIDGLLGPTEHEQLAEKVAGSPIAGPLIERIGAVVGNPSLSAPAAAGRGLADDPNTTAEFLDNVLDADQLAAFERVCIESDLHLGDVASCHRVLAELHRDQAALEPFAATSGRAALDAARAAIAGPVVDVSTRRGPPPRAAAGVRRRTSWLAWLSAAVALLLVLALGGVLLMLTLGRGGRPRQVAGAAGEQPAEVVVQPAPAVVAVEEPPAPPAPAPVVDAAPTPAVEAPPVVGPRPPAMPDPEVPIVPAAPPSPTPAVEPPAPATTPPAAATVPHGEAMAIGGGATAPSPPIAGDSAAAPSGPSAEPSGAAVRIDEGVVLARGAGAEQWRSMTPATQAGDAVEQFEVIAPFGVYPLLGVDGVAIRLHPGARVIVSRRADAAPVIEVPHGRVVVETTNGDSWPVISAGGLHGELGAMSGQPAGVEVNSAGPRQGEPDGATSERAVIHTAGAAVVWRQSPAGVGPHPVVGIPAEMPIPARTALRWDGRDPAAVRQEPCPTPAWMGEAAPANRFWERAAGDLVAVLAEAPPETAVEVLRRRAAGGLPEDRAAAAATLAFLGEPADLVALLCDEPPRSLNESQWVAVEALSVLAVLSRGGAEAAALLAAFRDRGPDGVAAAALAVGDEAATDPAALVDGLDADAIVVRRYSILRLREVAAAVGRTDIDGYRADRDPPARRDSVSW